ncbi:class I SAM-dependent methyltransferase [Cytophagaceae bacterium ABcell3]|nr:class I SAM-dependent methyltransferase [Cytophagaceae bacterium ABcell3]
MTGTAGIILRYIQFLLKSGNEHSVHSPFIFDLYTTVITPDKQYYVFEDIEGLRKSLLARKDSIPINDFGAGSRVTQSTSRRISSIAKNSEKPPKLAQLLFKITERFQPDTILDLGTSLGLTTLYLSKAAPKSTVYTFEGCPETLEVAKENFRKLNAVNIKPVLGNIDDTLPQVLQQIKSADLVFFDANHKYEATLNYFNICLQKATQDSIFIFDDIYWSSGMQKAWQEIKDNDHVRLSVDLFYMGLVFFRKKQPKQHFVLRP